MECNATRQAVCVNETVFDSTAEVPLEADIILPDYCPDIVKILKCSLNPCVKSSHSQGRQLCLEGVCSVQILYLGEDGTGGEGAGSKLRMRSIDYKIPFTKKLDLKQEADQVVVFLSKDSAYCNCRAVSKRRMELRGSLSYKICAVSCMQTQAVTDAADDTENPMGIQMRKKTMEQNSFVTQSRDMMDVNEELELAAGKPSIRNLISSRVCAVMNDCKLISGKIITKGELRIQVLYAPDSDSEGSKNGMEQMEYTLPISGVIDAPGADDSCSCLASYAVCEYELSPKSDQDGENTILQLRAQIAMRAEVCRKNEVCLADDCYSTRYACEGKTQAVNFLNLLETVEKQAMYKGEIELPAGTENIITGWGNVEGTSVRFDQTEQGQQAVVLVKLNLCLLATDQDGTIQFYDKTEEMEMEIPVQGGESFSKLIFCPQASARSFDYSRNGGSLQVRCEVMIRGCLAGINRCSVMGEIEIDQSKPVEREENCSLTIYYADAGENLWEIAKRYRTGMQAVMESNGQIELDENGTIPKREMLLIPILSN